MKFDPARDRWAFLNGGGLQRAYEFRETENKPIGNYAIQDLGDVIYAWLVGMHQEMNPVIPRALDWIDFAIENREETWFGTSPEFHRKALFCAQGLGRWMLDATSSKESFESSLVSYRRFIQVGGVKVLGPDRFNWERQRFEPHEVRGVPLTTDRVVKDGVLDDYMAFAVQSNQYADGLETYERFVGVKKPGLKRISKPRDYAYALCLNQLHPQFDEDDLFAAGRHMLQANMEDPWLARGQSLRAATWLKIVYWDRDLRAGRKPVLTPRQTVLKAYENMPDVAVPGCVSLD